MGAALSISAVDALARAIKNHAPQRWLTAPHHGTTDWSGLPEDLLLTVMAELDVPSIIRSGAVCTSWHHAYETFRRLRLPSPKQAPCMFYSCDEYGPNYGALYCPSTNATFRVPFQRPLEQSRGFISSCHGWVFATDVSGDPYLLNPITGSRAALPPLQYNTRSILD
nr:F-box protein At1g10110-like [Aegilops tauschii subsp. strangulata]